jgi:hypothetical protein
MVLFSLDNLLWLGIAEDPCLKQLFRQYGGMKTNISLLTGYRKFDS